MNYLKACMSYPAGKRYNASIPAPTPVVTSTRTPLAPRPANDGAAPELMANWGATGRVTDDSPSVVVNPVAVIEDAYVNNPALYMAMTHSKDPRQEEAVASFLRKRKLMPVIPEHGQDADAHDVDGEEGEEERSKKRPRKHSSDETSEIGG